MAIGIITTGYLINEAGPKDNPREEEFFSFEVLYSAGGSESAISWSLVGDSPVGVSIDSSVVISGTVSAMFNQPSCVPKDSDIYAEIDGRSYPDNIGRFSDDPFTFNFNVRVDWMEDQGSGLLPFSATSPVNIILIKNYDVDGDILAQEILDGDGTRLPYHCKFKGPSTQSQCEKIGGTWNSDNNVCSIGTPLTQIKCEEVGGTWEEKKAGNGDYFCNIVIIQTQVECELIGGTWTKNTLNHEGVEYDNSVDWFAAKGA